MPWHEFHRRADPVYVHNHVGGAIPPYVIAFLSKGGKFIPDMAAPRPSHIMTSLSSLERSLNLAKHFNNYTTAPSDTLARKKQRRSISTWNPKPDPDVSVYIRLLRHELENYTTKPILKNLTFFDRKAMAWLHRHSNSVVVADTDKNLGDGLFERQWVDQQISHWLAKSFIVLPEHLFNKHMIQGKHAFLDGLYSFRDHIPSKEREFLLQNLATSGSGTFSHQAKSAQECTRFPASCKPAA